MYAGAKNRIDHHNYTIMLNEPFNNIYICYNYQGSVVKRTVVSLGCSEFCQVLVSSDHRAKIKICSIALIGENMTLITKTYRGIRLP